MSQPLNVLLITADQMRRDHVGCYGNPTIRTPHLDALAAGGVCLDRAYVSNPVCMPNRATIATGRLPRNHRCWSNGIALPIDERTVADELNDRGYHTALLGKGHLTSFGVGPDKQDPYYDSFAAWAEGKMTPEWAGPYYGFTECQLALGHGTWGMRRGEGLAGHYGHWLDRNCPGVIDRAVQSWQTRRSATGAPQCCTLDLPAEVSCSSWLGDVTCQHLRERAAEGKPFLTWVSFPDPHHPFCPPAPYDTMHDPADVVMPRFGAEALADKPKWFRQAYEGGQLWEGINANDVLKDVTEVQLRDIIARTYGMISLMDVNIGRMLETLRETGLADSTVVIFTSDHGDLMGDGGLIFKGPFLLEGLINVPMIWAVPGAAVGGHRPDLFNSCDIAPTILQLLSVDVPPAMDGLAQGELVGGGPGARDAAVVEFRSMYRRELNLRSIITADRKLTHYAGQDCGELYDMTAEVPEARNLHDDPAHAGERAELERRLLDMEIRSEDSRCQPICHA